MTVTKEIKETAKGLFKSNPKVKYFFVNKEGEFFTSENYCKLSVANPKDYTKINRTDG